MAQCDLSLSFPTCKTEERLCRLSYTSWCPTCDGDSPRRRSKSETNEPCRRRGKEMKSTLKKYEWNQECENMDVEYETKDIRFDSFRIRSNLCELPTTYITNNCQMKLSNCSDFDLEKGIRESNFKPNLQNFGMTEKQEGIAKIFPRIEDAARNINGIVGKLQPKLEHLKPHLAHIPPSVTASSHVEHLSSKNARTSLPPKTQTSNEHDWKVYRPANGTTTSPVRPAYNYNALSPKYNELYNAEMRNKTTLKKQLSSSTKQNQSTGNVIQEVLFQCPPKPKTKSPKAKPLTNIHEIFNHSIQNNTENYYNEKFDIVALKERYAREVKMLKERMQSLKDSSKDNHITVSAPVTRREDLKSQQILKNRENIKMDFERIRQMQAEKTGAIPKVPVTSTTENSNNDNKKVERLKVTSSKVSIKTKQKLSASKLAKSKSKASVPIDDAFDSDLNESEDSDKESELESEDDSISTVSSKEIIPTHKRKVSANSPSSWNLRESLFPHIPPYLTFSLYDAPPHKLPFGSRHLKWKMSTITPILVRKTLTNSGFRLVRKSNDWMGTWGKHMKSPLFRTLKETQKLNHFPGTFQIGRKDRLWRNLQRAISMFGHKEFGFSPLTFVLPQDLKILRQHWHNKNGSGDEKYIIKPPAAARGTGIKVINRWAQLPKRMSLVVQEYISNPYLINGSKFDLRLYVLVTSFNPVRIYLYPDGLARFASVPYSADVKDIKDRYMHLTNYSINKTSCLYTANEDANACKGHKWTISKLLEYMAKRGINTQILWKNLQQLVIKTIICGEYAIVPLCTENLASRYNCYELFGIDVLLDENLKAWLLEVNISPSLHSQSPLDEHVKGPMLKSIFDLAQFHLPPKIAKTEKLVPSCLDSKVYSVYLTKKERNKHNYFSQADTRKEYVDDILKDLTGDDVRHLTQAEDELTVTGQFQRIFPTAHTFKYLQYMETRYYNRLFDAWECKYEKNRQPGINILKSYCEQKVHLKVAPPPSVTKSSQNSNLGEQNSTTEQNPENEEKPTEVAPTEDTIQPMKELLCAVVDPEADCNKNPQSVDLHSLCKALQLESNNKLMRLSVTPRTDVFTKV